MSENKYNAWNPPCEKCAKPMRLTGKEAHDVHPNTDLHTYECECGEISVFQVSQMQGRA